MIQAIKAIARHKSCAIFTATALAAVALFLLAFYLFVDTTRGGIASFIPDAVGLWAIVAVGLTGFDCAKDATDDHGRGLEDDHEEQNK